MASEPGTSTAGFSVVRLCSEQLFPVCSPKLVSGSNRITRASDLLKFSLLRLDDWKTWSRWFEAAGVTDPRCSRSGSEPREHADRCCLDGHGIALARGLPLGAEKKARLHQKRSGLQSSTKLQSSQANSGCMRPELGRVLQ